MCRVLRIVCYYYYLFLLHHEYAVANCPGCGFGCGCGLLSLPWRRLQQFVPGVVSPSAMLVRGTLVCVSNALMLQCYRYCY